MDDCHLSLGTMLPRHRRRQYLAGNTDPRRPALLVRLVIGTLIVCIVWFVASKAIRFFDGSVGRKTAAVLELRSTESVQVALQEQEWQRGENGLKLYAGDAVATRATGDATLKFFDGTRVRLDVGTDVLVEESDSESEGISSITITVRSGRIWISSPSMQTYSGAIVRTIQTANSAIEIPASAHVLASSSLINVMRSSGIGVQVTLTFIDPAATLLVGEGQYLSLSEEAKRFIEDGKDPYEFRDPVTIDLLKDPFLVSSYSQAVSSPNGASSPTSSGATSSANDDQPLILTSPENNAQINSKTVTVSGKVSPRVAEITLNGQTTPIKSDLSFTAELSLPKDQQTFVMTVEARDAQGVPVAKVERTVKSIFNIVVDPVRFKSPVGSGETLNTAQGEVEITGEVSTGIASVTVNDYTLQLFKPGSKTWSYLASASLGNMKPGPNIFTVYASDADGNKSPSRSITIVFTPDAAPAGTGSTAVSSSQPALKQNPPLTPGVLAVDKPAMGTSAVVSEKETVIEGRTSADTASISINGYTLSLYVPGKTMWNYIASTEYGTMKRGKNVYRIVARNKDGEILDVLEYTMTFNP